MVRTHTSDPSKTASTVPAKTDVCISAALTYRFEVAPVVLGYPKAEFQGYRTWEEAVNVANRYGLPVYDSEKELTTGLATLNFRKPTGECWSSIKKCCWTPGTCEANRTPTSASEVSCTVVCLHVLNNV